MHLLVEQSGHQPAVTRIGVIQQRAFDESRGCIRARPVGVADDPFCCPTAADATSALA
jgi:hypothetical protein